ncbi:M56 family metallopeptidase [uncultured Pontibacter sp.]|uniref:M56 family metallopeptidase n=1 Tax=uncultured Pontibacter sp. TaxID=453356 RepID=UPI0026260EAE|nr:M56 family metallopeptidase [uncultured Pontibacter sp.]
MPTLLLYLLKANVALVLFYLAYHLVLRKLTFYHLNRIFLVFGIVFSAVYPLVDLTELFSRHEELAAMQSYAVVLPAWTPTAIPEQAEAFDYWLIPVGLFWLGCGLMLLRLIMQFASLYQIHRASVPASYQGVGYRKVQGISEAFSFWKTIYLNPTQHQSPELESILRHEQIHVNGWHTLDVLLAELSTVFYWFNPGVWLMKKAMKENLEFIADQHVVDAGVDRVAYQYLLLKVVGATQPQIANQFNFPSLKRRIVMMNKMPTSKANRLRLLVVLPLVTVLLVAFRNATPLTESIANIAETETLQQNEGSKLPDELVDILKNILTNHPAIKSVRGKVVDNRNAVVISLKDGGTEIYYLDSSKSIAALERKYGELPSTPPVTRRDKTGQEPIYTSEDYEEFLIRNPNVKRVYWVPDEEASQESKVDRMVVELKSGGLESYRMVYKSEIDAAEKKYGKLPAKPARPPMVDNSELPVPPAPYNPDQDERAKKVAEEHKAFYARNPQVRKIEWISRNEIRVRLESTEEIYKMTDKKSRAAAEKKYGQFPSSPGAAQVVSRAEFESQKNNAVQQQNGERIFSPTDIGYYQDRKNLPVEYTNFLKRNPTIDKVGWKIHPEKGPQAVVLFLKSGTTEIYNLNDQKSMAKAKSKYGEFPGLLPPPPPVMIKDELPPPPPPAPAAPDAPPAPDKNELLSGMPKGALYYIDGVEASREALQKLDPKTIHSMNVVKGKTAVDLFGNRASKGVVSFVTEKNKESRQVQEFNKKLPTPPAPPVPNAPGTPPPPSAPADIPVKIYIPDADNLHEDHKAFLKRNSEVKEIGWMIGENDSKKLRMIILYLNEGKTEAYDLDNEASIAKAEKKYGKLPNLPPPPPPVKKQK